MQPQQKRSSARVLAPLALLVCAFAVLIVIIGVVAGGDSRPSAPEGEQARSTSREDTGSAPAPKTPRTYTVETNDTLSAIAEETGVPVERLLELNPALDPQALVAGQKIKLVE